MKRIVELSKKLFSVKGCFAILFTVLLFLNRCPAWMPFSAWILFILGREYFKHVIGLKGFLVDDKEAKGEKCADQGKDTL
jgi:hypothetical protein